MNTQTRMSPSEVGELGEDIYQQKIRRIVEPENHARYLAIDVLSGDYEIGGPYRNPDARLATTDALLERRPEAEVYLRLIGYQTSVAIGTALRPDSPLDQ